MRRSMDKTRATDWGMIRERLAQARARMEESTHPSPERARAVMAARARDLARVPPAVRGEADSFRAVAFRTGNRRYALEARYIREIARPGQVIAIPGLPAFMRGLVPLRGSMVLAVHAASLLGAAASGVADFPRMIVVGLDAAEFGLLVEDIEEVVRLWRTDLQPLPEASGSTHLLRGLAPGGLALVDGARLLDDPRLFIDGPGLPGTVPSPTQVPGGHSDD